MRVPAHTHRHLPADRGPGHRVLPMRQTDAIHDGRPFWQAPLQAPL